MVLFANYKTLSVSVDDKGKKHKAQGGRRVLYTNHHPCWDAKNRYGLPDECEFDYEVIRHIIEPAVQESVSPPVQRQEPQIQKPVESPKENVSMPAGEQMSLPLNKPEPQKAPDKAFPAQDARIPKALRDLMEMNHVDEWDIQNVVAAKGYFPADMPIADYPEDFVSGVLVGAWQQVFAMIQQMKEKQEIPFN